MDRGHLRTDDRVVFAHFFCEDYTLIVCWFDRALLMLFLLDADRREERTDTDASSTEVVDLIDLQAGVDFAGTG